MIEIRCPGCGQLIQVSDEFTGRYGNCNNCNASITVPRPVQFASEPVDQSSTIRLESAGSKIPPRTNLSYSSVAPSFHPFAALVAGFIGVLIAGGAISALYFFKQHRNHAAGPAWAPTSPQSTAVVTVSYDRFQNAGEASVGGFSDRQWRMLIGDGPGHFRSPSPDTDSGAYIGFRADYDGPTLQKPPLLISIDIVYNYGADQTDMPTDSLYFLIDGQRASATIIASHPNIATAAMPADMALKMSHARNVEMECGPSQFKLTDQEVAGLSDLLTDLGFQNVSVTK
jgi:hypothetical protein